MYTTGKDQPSAGDSPRGGTLQPDRVNSQARYRRPDRPHAVLAGQVAASCRSRRRRPFDPHARPPSSSAIASSCETAPGRPAATHAWCAASVASISASSSSSAEAWRCRACRRRKSATGTTTAASPPKWITSNGEVSGTGVDGSGSAVTQPMLAGEAISAGRRTAQPAHDPPAARQRNERGHAVAGTPAGSDRDFASGAGVGQTRGSEVALSGCEDANRPARNP